MDQPTKAKTAFLAEILQAGEEYAGIILGKNGQPDYHLFLRPGQASSVDWEGAKAFAAGVGGELPTRREQALLYANLKEHFEPYFYWSAEQHESSSSYAWGQDFSSGSQYYWSKSSNYRARAVRRVVIE